MSKFNKKTHVTALSLLLVSCLCVEARGENLSGQILDLNDLVVSDAMVEVLPGKIIGAGGLAPMVPNEHVNTIDARKIVQWILDSSSELSSALSPEL